MQSGGTLIGQGVYGCTFDPAPPCAGGPVFKKHRDKDIVGKIVSDDPTAELDIGKAIMSLPLASAYFALPSASCKPQMPVLDPDAKGCRVLTESGEGTKFSMLLMPDGGLPIIKYAQDQNRLAKNYKRIFIHLLEGGAIYQNAGYVHNDIHMGNILVDDAGVARYIDFGLAFRPDSVKKWEDSNLGTEFKPQYFMQAPEVHAWRMYLSGIRLADGVATIKELHPEYRQMEQQFPKRKDAVTALRDLMMQEAHDSGALFIRKYAKKFDSWRIGLCMWLFWNDMLMAGITSLYQERDLIRQVLSGLTEFDPRKRLTITEALRILDPNNRMASLTP